MVVSGWSGILLFSTCEVITEGATPKLICLAVFSSVGIGARSEASAGHTWLEFLLADNSTVGTLGPVNISLVGSVMVAAGVLVDFLAAFVANFNSPSRALSTGGKVRLRVSLRFEAYC